LDVLRYHLAKFVKIEKIILFSGKMFVGRGLKQDKPIYTSSLIFVVEKSEIPLLHNVEIINYQNPDSDVEQVLKDISVGKNVKRQKVLQTELLRKTSNWNFIKQSKEFLDFYDEYMKVTEDISVYYNHILAKMKFSSIFFFDRGVKYPKDKIKPLSELTDVEFYNIASKNKGVFFQKKSNLGIDRKLLDFPFGSQGEEVFRKKYKILWSYVNYDKFRFSDEKLVLDYNTVLISSDNKEELLFLFSLLNSKISKLILDAFFRNENEKDILIGIKTIKEFIQIPAITENNKKLKDLIISLTEQLLNLEKPTLADFIDFSLVMMQRFDDIYIEQEKLVLEKDKDTLKLLIKKNPLLVGKVIETAYHKNGLEIDKQTITLTDLKSLPVIDFDKQKEIVSHIDDLVFCLYFNIDIPKDKITDADFVKNLCMQNKFYKLVCNN